MTVLIPITNAEFDASEQVEIFTAIREGWDMLRSLQFDQVADILRYTVTTPGDPATHLKPVTALVPGLTGWPALVQDVDKRLAEKLGFALEEDMKTFYFYGLWDAFGGLLLTDRIQWPATTGYVYRIVRVDNSEEEGLSVAWSARLDK